MFRMMLCIPYEEVKDYPIEDDYYRKRLKTYEQCSEIDIANPTKWAKAGFIWSSRLKTICCQYCRTRISEVNSENFLRKDHCAMKEHVKRNPSCKFVAPYLQRPVHQEMKAENIRSQSFKKQSGELIISNEWLKRELVLMGVFCKQNDDLGLHALICYHCDLTLGGIRNEEISIGMEQEARTYFISLLLWRHADESPECAHMIKSKGVEYIKEIMESDMWATASEFSEESDEEGDDNSTKEENNIKIEAIKEIIDKRYWNMPDAGIGGMTVNSQQNLNKEEYLCKICLTNQSDVLFLPCRHFMSCTECNQGLKDKCHICRQAIDKKINIYM